jgi:hypothetical protein
MRGFFGFHRCKGRRREDKYVHEVYKLVWVGDSLKIWVQVSGGVSNDRKRMHHRWSGDYM